MKFILRCPLYKTAPLGKPWVLLLEVYTLTGESRDGSSTFRIADSLDVKCHALKVTHFDLNFDKLRLKTSTSHPGGAVS